MSDLNIGKVIVDQTKTSQVVVNYQGTSRPNTTTIISNRSQMVAEVDTIDTAFNANTTYYYDENGSLSASNEGYGLAGFTDSNGVFTSANVFINISTGDNAKYTRTIEGFNDFRGTCSELVTEIKIYGIKPDTSEVLLATTIPYLSEGTWQFHEDLIFSEDDFDQNEQIIVKAVSEEWIISDKIAATVRDITILEPCSTVTRSDAYFCLGYANLSNVDTITVSVYKLPVWVQIGRLTVTDSFVSGDIDCSSLTTGSNYFFKFTSGTAESQYNYQVVGS